MGFAVVIPALLIVSLKYLSLVNGKVMHGSTMDVSRPLGEKGVMHAHYAKDQMRGKGALHREANCSYTTYTITNTRTQAGVVGGRLMSALDLRGACRELIHDTVRLSDKRTNTVRKPYNTITLTFTFLLPLMAPPKKYLTLEAKRLSVREKSKRYYERNRLQIRLRQRRASASKDSTVVNVKHVTRLGKTNALEIQTRKKHLKHQANSPPSSKKPAPPPPLPLINLFLKLNAEANALQDKFNSFIQGMSISEYAESLLKAYFKSSSKCQGQIGVFVDPLEELYDLRDSYTKTEARSREVEGLSARHKALAQAGIPIHRVVEWVEDFWRCAIDGPGSFLRMYNRRQLAWQRDTVN
ncbi:hypothetical protein EV421DRAFT_1740111 [Armillaria borealis]|uniref:Uncharacterized protein n=1 Tax=Armillaria borealis TaxID=47425 RepID=A0AA39J3W2_9AGAR|nr:hypothetical protein EV421DRAFT_1740111 [Armillaria borealis]